MAQNSTADICLYYVNSVNMRHFKPGIVSVKKSSHVNINMEGCTVTNKNNNVINVDNAPNSNINIKNCDFT